MIREHSRNATIGIGLGLPMSVAGQIIGHDILWGGSSEASPNHWAVVFVLTGIGALLFFYGCYQFAMAKGLSGAWGFLGLFCGILGLAVIVLLPDQSLGARRSKFAHVPDELPPEPPDITVHVLLFAELRERAGVDRTEIFLTVGMTVSMAIDVVADQFPALRMLVRKAKCVVNNNPATRLTRLKDGDELALVPTAATA